MNEGTKTARDPVCRLEIDLDDAASQETFAGRTYFFCSEDCAELFRENPEDYVPGTAKA
jgi:Cu+-exporting ATPase